MIKILESFQCQQLCPYSVQLLNLKVFHGWDMMTKCRFGSFILSQLIKISNK